MSDRSGAGRRRSGRALLMGSREQGVASHRPLTRRGAKLLFSLAVPRGPLVYGNVARVAPSQASLKRKAVRMSCG